MGSWGQAWQEIDPQAANKQIYILVPLFPPGPRQMRASHALRQARGDGLPALPVKTLGEPPSLRCIGPSDIAAGGLWGDPTHEPITKRTWAEQKEA